MLIKPLAKSETLLTKMTCNFVVKPLKILQIKQFITTIKKRVKLPQILKTLS